MKMTFSPQREFKMVSFRTDNGLFTKDGLENIVFFQRLKVKWPFYQRQNGKSNFCSRQNGKCHLCQRQN